MKQHRISAGVLLTCALAAGCRHEESAPGSSAKSVENASVATAKIDRGRVEQSLDTYGKVEFAADRQRSVSFVQPGLVVAVPVVEGQTIRKSDELLRVGRVPRGAPEVQQATIAAEFAGRDLDRVKRLVDERLATNQELRSAEKQLAVADAALRALGGGGTGGMSIGTPMDGIVAKVLVHRGDLVQVGQIAVMIAARDSMTVRAGFEVEDLPKLSEGLPVRIASAFRGRDEKPADATLSTLHRVVDPRTQLVEGVIRVNDPPKWMAPGLSVRIAVVLAAHDDVVRVPRAGLIERGGATGVFVIHGGRASWRVLRLGLATADEVEVVAGLSAGEEVATTGRTSLSDGMAVRLARVDTP